MAEGPRARPIREDMFLGGEGEDEADDGGFEKFFPSPWNRRRDSMGLVTRTSSILLLSNALGTAILFYRANQILDIQFQFHISKHVRSWHL